MVLKKKTWKSLQISLNKKPHPKKNIFRDINFFSTQALLKALKPLSYMLEVYKE
jgi:hypothetical protein